MADPSKYERTYSFTDFQTGNPSSPLPGIQVDNELENVEQSLEQVVNAIKDVRRSDGKLKNGIVTVDSLDPTVAAGVGSGALASAAAAAASAGAAADSAEAAAASAGSAAGYSNTAATSAGTAMAARNDALNAADDATAMAVAATGYRDFAAQWSSAPQGQDVNDGVNPVGKSSYHWAQVALGAAAGALPDGSVTTEKLADGAVTAAKLAADAIKAPTVDTLDALRALDTTVKTGALVLDPVRFGVFAWNGADLSSTLIFREIQPLTLDAATDRLAMRNVASSSVNSTTNVITTATDHGFTADQRVTVASSVNGLVNGGRYFIFYDADTTAAAGGNLRNFKLRTSLTAGAFDLTGTVNFTTREEHDLRTGHAVLVDGVLRYIIRIDNFQVQLAASFADAQAGTAIDLSAGSAPLLRELIDPLQGRYVIPTGFALDGSQGAWVRAYWNIHAAHMGALGDGVADDGHAIQAAIWLGGYLRRPVSLRAGTHLTSVPLEYVTKDWLYTTTTRQGPDNGIYINGAGRELSIIKANDNFPNSRRLLTLDGHPNASAQIVGSRPYSQGSNYLQGFGLHGRGKAVGTNVGGVYVRGVWGQEWHDIDLRDFSGQTVELGSGATELARDEVDNTSMWRLRKVRAQEGGKSAFYMNAVRPTAVSMKDCEIRYFNDWGINGALVGSVIENTVIEGCGNGSDTTTCGIRLSDAVSGSLCRNVVLRQVLFENNRNQEIDVVMCRGLTIEDCGFNIFPTSASHRAIKLRLGALGGTRDIQLRNNRHSDFSVPGGVTKTDVYAIQIDSGVTDVTIDGMSYDYASSHVLGQSLVRFKAINVPDTFDADTTGSTPVDSFVNGKCIGTRTDLIDCLPVLQGATTGGVRTGGDATGKVLDDGTWMEFDVDYSQTSHTGTGGIRIVLAGLPRNFAVNSTVDLYYEGLTYTAAPQALAQGGSKNIFIRQSATTTTGPVNVNVPTGVATIRLRGRVRGA